MTRLEEFVAAARQRIASGTYALQGPALPHHGSLREALAAHPYPVIAELKPASPSAGVLLTGAPQRIIEAYQQGGAAAISCLADADFFDGSPALVRTCHDAGVPILWKDFIVDRAQIAAAAHNGASAILLIERILDPRQREELVAVAHAAGLEVLLEVHARKDWRTAQSSAADLIGVNARDLETLEVDVASSKTLLAEIASERPVVALSGITSRQDRRDAMAAGATAVLVGTHLMTAADPLLALRSLQRPLAKTCGLRSLTDVEAAAAAGADLVGFVVGAPDSPRNVEPLRAQQLSDAAKANGLRTALVTPHTDAWEVREWCRLVRPDYVQLHGLAPDPEWLHSLKAIPTIPVHVVRPDQTPPPGAFLLDASDGKGHHHSWPVGSGASTHLSLVAGGLDAGNVAAAISTTQCWGADASSGLESTPGTKDAAKIRAFVEACHGA